MLSELEALLLAGLRPLSTRNLNRRHRERRRTKGRRSEKSRASKADMNPEPVIKAAIELAQAQLRLSSLVTRALLGIQEQTANPPSSAKDALGEVAVERAAAAIVREMLRHKDVGFASLLRTNFPPDELRRIAQAALQAACQDGQEQIMGSTKGSGQTSAGEPHRSEDERQREKLGPRGVPGKADEAEMTPQQEKNIQKNVDPGHTA